MRVILSNANNIFTLSQVYLDRNNSKSLIHYWIILVCPIISVNNYLKALPEESKTKDNAFFLNNQLLPLTRQSFNVQLKILLDHLGLDNRQYSSHSFRHGAATSCSAAGVEDHLIQTLGRWSSNCYIRYIHTPESAISRAQRQMCVDKK